MENKFINQLNIKERFKYFSFFIFLIPLFMSSQNETQRFNLIKTFDGRIEDVNYSIVDL